MKTHLYRFIATLGLIGALLAAPAFAVAEQARIDAALHAFQTLVGEPPAWADSARLDALLAALDGLRHDGLDPQDYGVEALREQAHSPQTQACVASLAARAYLHALDDLRHGRLDPDRIEPLWHAGGGPTREDPQRLARRAADGLDDVAAAFDAARPALPVYAALRRHMADLLDRSGTEEPSRLPEGLTLRRGMHHPTIASLRERLAFHGFTPDSTPADLADFDAALDEAVRHFQQASGLQQDGVVGRATRAALNQDLAVRIARTRANLERWRWLASELLPTQVRVDVAAAEVRYLRDGAMVWSSRVQVGRSERATPLLHSVVTHITLNPPWIVPPTILRKDKLPAIRANPRLLEESGLRVFDRSGAELDPDRIDWSAPGPITLRQDPGPFNALGQVAIRFPSPFSVYLHDTPSQLQFSSWQRTFSSGCVRVERAMELAELLLADGADIGTEALAVALSTGDTRNLRLLRPVPILIAYWTADSDADGRLRWRPDSYAHDARIAAELVRAPAHIRAHCARSDLAIRTDGPMI